MRGLAATIDSFAHADGPTVLQGVDLRFHAGSLVGVIGPNGAGKSTLLTLLAGLAHPKRGEVTLDGRALQHYGRREWARRLAWLPQRAELPDAFSVEAIVAMGRAPHLGLLGSMRQADRQAVRQALMRTGLTALASVPVGALSGGERQRVALARTAAQEPQWLLMDEPTAHLDLRYQVETMRFAREAASDGVGVIAVLHDPNLAARCDRVVVLDQGRIAFDGAPAEVLTPERLSPVFGTRLRSLADGERSWLLPA